jgi:pimeloyl-ACP methyl ester carboxylesterase
MRLCSYDIRLTIAPIGKKVLSVSSGSIVNDRIYVDRHGEEIDFYNQDIRLAGTLYKPETEGSYPGIVLLHGSTPEGRKLGIYRLLGKELAEKGYVVLSFDFRGYGESDDPASVNSIADFDTVSDTQSAINYLNSLKEVSGQPSFIIGHSGGAEEAIIAGIDDPRIKKIVLIGPPRRVHERFGSVDDPEFAYFQRRMMRYMGLSQPIPDQIYLDISRSMDLASYLDYFTQPEHKPILLIDGMLEDEKDRQYLQQIYSSMTGPKKHITLSNADHYANIANLGFIIFYDQEAQKRLINEITAWLSLE